MFHTNQFPNDLILQYLQQCHKLKKFEKVVFKRFAPNVAEVSTDFNRLAVKFEEACLFQYAAMCYLGAAKCEKSLGHSVGEIDFALKSAKAFIKANDEIVKLRLQSNTREYIEGALKSYNHALSKLEDDSAMKAAVIREMKKLSPTFEGTSSFASPCHRIFDLEFSASESLKNKDYASALEKLTDIFDNITERKKESLYVDVLSRCEVSRLLLLVILDLPPGRQSPSHIKLLEKYSNDDFEDITREQFVNIPLNVQISLKDLVKSWQEKDLGSISKSVRELMDYKSLNKQHKRLLEAILLTLNL